IVRLVRVREGTTEMVNHDNLRAPLQQSQEDAAKVGKNNFDSFGLLSGSVPFNGEELMCSVTTCRNKIKGKGDVNTNASQFTPSWRRRQKSALTPSGSKSDDVTTKCDDVTVVDKKNPLEDLTG
nr:hypothetical protein [Tanacetum cinerariifolium]